MSHAAAGALTKVNVLAALGLELLAGHSDLARGAVVEEHGAIDRACRPGKSQADARSQRCTCTLQSGPVQYHAALHGHSLRGQSLHEQSMQGYRSCRGKKPGCVGWHSASAARQCSMAESC